MFPTVEAPSVARRALRSLADSLDDDSLSHLSSVVSELVATSVTHGASHPIILHVEVRDGGIHGELRDHGVCARAIARARESGGEWDDSLMLRLVDGLVEEWGADPHGARVWFRMPTGLNGEARLEA